jgi:hypothetical protein
MDVADWKWVRGIWDLTCVFWAKNAKNKCEGEENSRSPAGMTPRTTTATAKAGSVGLEKSEGLGCVDFFGILHCVQDDGKKMRGNGNGNSRSPAGMTAKKQEQKQGRPQIVRLRCSRSAMSDFAQDDRVEGGLGRVAKTKAD